MFESLSNGFKSFVKFISAKSVFTEKNLEEAVEILKTALIEADVNLRVARRFINQIQEEVKGEKVFHSLDPKTHFLKIVNDKLISFLGEGEKDLNLLAKNKISYILLLGLQGSGKTTTIVKIANRLKNSSRKVLIVAADFTRPAAVEQLKVLASPFSIEVFSKNEESSPVSLIRSAKSYAEVNSFDTVLIDTAGRLENDDNLLKEARDIKDFLNPSETLLVCDTMLGQVAVNIARDFNEKVGITGVVLTKFDSDTRGGAVLSLKTVANVPIKFVGTGERVEDIELFYPQRLASRILGMGDIRSLVEKAEKILSDDEKNKSQLESNNFDLDMYLSQFSYIEKMGGLQNVLALLPNMNEKAMGKINREDIKRERAIISSMTRLERKNPIIINPSRKRRIAKGSGMTILDVNKLLKKYNDAKLMFKKMKNKEYQRKIGSLMGFK